MRLLLASSSALGLVLVSTWSATALIGDVFGVQAALGPRLATVGETAIYSPWAIFEWTPRFANDFPKPFAIARLVVFAGFIAAACLFALALKDKDKLKPFGQNAWGRAACVGGRIIDRQLNVRPTQRVRPVAPVRVLVARNIQLRSYRE